MLVGKFIETEDKNFALFNYVNELNNEIEMLREQIVEVENEIEQFKQDSVGLEEQRERIMKDLQVWNVLLKRECFLYLHLLFVYLNKRIKILLIPRKLLGKFALFAKIN